MKFAYVLLMTFGITLSSYTLTAITPDTTTTTEEVDIFSDDVDVADLLEVMDKIPEKDLTFGEKMSLAGQFIAMQAKEHPYYVIAGVTVTAATLAAIIYLLCRDTKNV